MNKIGVILKINIKSAILIMNNFGAKNCTLLTDVEAKKVMSVFNFGKHVVNMFYQSFRQALYQKQKDELLRWLKVKPKIPQEREYMGTTVYLYLYNNKLYVLEKPIRTKEPKKHTEEERLLIKNIYLRSYRKVLSRSFAFKFHLNRIYN